MDLQFRKDLIPYLQTVANETDSREQTQEVRLPDGMPDIGHVLGSYGQVLIRGKEWRSGGAGVNGGVMVWVLYAPEDDSGLQCVETWIPFQMKWELDTATVDGVICVHPMLESIDARSTAARKLMIRAGIGMVMQAKQENEAEEFQPDDLPEDVCILQNTYPMFLPTEAGEKAFSMEETVDLPASVPTPEKILYYDLYATSTDQRILTDKLVFRGEAVLRFAYLDAAQNVCKWSCEIPFSQYAELNRDYSDNAKSRMVFAVTNLELEKNTEDRLVVKAGLLGQYTICDRKDVTVVEDAYSTRRKLELQKASVRLPAVLDTVEQTIYPKLPKEDMNFNCTDIMFYPAMPRLYHDSEGLVGTLSGTFHGLGEDMEGHLQGATKQWEENWTLPADPDIQAELTLQCGAVSDMGAELHLEGQLFACREIPVVIGLELGEETEPDPNRPSLILCKMGEQTLWEVAKSAGSTMEAILKANGLSQMPDPDKMLLIPIQ